MNSLEVSTSVKDEVDKDGFSEGGPKEEFLMDWEVPEDVGNVDHPSTVASKIVSQVPLGETGVLSENFDVESFSFASSEDEEESAVESRPGVNPVLELSTVLDLKVLQIVIEASADALDAVVGKDVVLVAGKTGTCVACLLCFYWTVFGMAPALHPEAPVPLHRPRSGLPRVLVPPHMAGAAALPGSGVTPCCAWVPSTASSSNKYLMLAVSLLCFPMQAWARAPYSRGLQGNESTRRSSRSLSLEKRLLRRCSTPRMLFLCSPLAIRRNPRQARSMLFYAGKATPRLYIWTLRA